MLRFNAQTAADLVACLGATAQERIHAKSLQIGDVVLSGGAPFVVCACETRGDIVHVLDADGIPATYFSTSTPAILRRDLRRAELAAEATSVRLPAMPEPQ
jgi:hypothetical protein